MFSAFFELSLMIQIGVLYVAAINVLTFFYFGIDKMKARGGRRRISEKMLWVLSLLGGSVGALMAMHFFRHKTQKLSFQAGMAVILALQITIIMLLTT